MSAAVSKMGVAGLFFAEPVVKVDGKLPGMFFYRNKCYPQSDMLR